MLENSFRNIRFSGLWAVCKAVNRHRIGDVGFIRSVVSESSLHFEESLAFLNHIGVIKIKDSKIVRGRWFPGRGGSEEEFRHRVLDVIFHEPKRFPELREFFACFVIAVGRISFTPSHAQKVYFGDVRDILHDLGFISYNPSRTTYFVQGEMVESFLGVLENQRMSPRQLKSRLHNQEQTGLEAELFALDFEYQRLKPFGIKKQEILHVSLSNVLAGYDIRSYDCTENNPENRISRFIEVKAVSSSDWSFFWSRNEIETASKLRHLYCLYLVPALPGGKGFDKAKVLIIPDAYSTVFLNEIEWPRRTETFHFSGRT